MKHLLFCCSVFVASFCNGQVPAAMPPEADTFYNEAMPVIKGQLKNAVLKTAASMQGRTANADSLSMTLKKNPAFKGINDQALKGVTTLIMVQASKNADDDLKKMVLSMRGNNESLKAGKSDPRSTEDEKQFKLKLIMLLKSQLAEELSTVMKQMASDRASIIEYLR